MLAIRTEYRFLIASLTTVGIQGHLRLAAEGEDIQTADPPGVVPAATDITTAVGQDPAVARSIRGRTALTHTKNVNTHHILSALCVSGDKGLVN